MELRLGITLLLASSLAIVGLSSKPISANAAATQTVYVGVDLPFSTSSSTSMTDAYNSMNAYLQKVGGKAGKYKVVLHKYDDSTVAKGSWDDIQCLANARAHIKAVTEVAVIGTYNSGCSMLEVPILNSKNMMMISFANTYPGLTVVQDQGEPGIYYPNRKRNYARVSTPDTVQGIAAAQYSFNDAGTRHCAVIVDDTKYGNSVGGAFKSRFEQLGGRADRYIWDSTASSYVDQFTTIRDSGADCLYLSGTYDNNGGQLINDAISVLGNQSAFFKIANDGFGGYPDLEANLNAEGLFMTYSGEPLEAMAGRIRLSRNYYSDYSVHAISALQVVLAAIAKSKGTKSSVRDQVFTGTGITIPAKTSIFSEAFSIDPRTGDNRRRIITLTQMTSGVEEYRQIIRVP